MLSILLLAAEFFAAVLLIGPLHEMLGGLGFIAENCLSGLIIAALPAGIGLIFFYAAEDRFVIPYAFLLLLLYTAVVVLFCLFRKESQLILTLLLPTLGLEAVVGNLLFWGLYYAGNKNKRNSEVV